MRHRTLPPRAPILDRSGRRADTRAGDRADRRGARRRSARRRTTTLTDIAVDRHRVAPRPGLRGRARLVRSRHRPAPSRLRAAARRPARCARDLDRHGYACSGADRRVGTCCARHRRPGDRRDTRRTPEPLALPTDEVGASADCSSPTRSSSRERQASPSTWSRSRRATSSTRCSRRQGRPGQAAARPRSTSHAQNAAEQAVSRATDDHGARRRQGEHWRGAGRRERAGPDVVQHGVRRPLRARLDLQGRERRDAARRRRGHAPHAASPALTRQSSTASSSRTTSAGSSAPTRPSRRRSPRRATRPWSIAPTTSAASSSPRWRRSSASGADWDLGLDAYSGSAPADTDLVTRAADMIGQGKVVASPLAMAMVAAAVDSGVSRTPTLLPGRVAGHELGCRARPAGPRRPAADDAARRHRRHRAPRQPAGLPVYAKTGTAEFARGQRAPGRMPG